MTAPWSLELPPFCKGNGDIICPQISPPAPIVVKRTALLPASARKLGICFKLRPDQTQVKDHLLP